MLAATGRVIERVSIPFSSGDGVVTRAAVDPAGFPLSNKPKLLRSITVPVMRLCLANVTNAMRLIKKVTEEHRI